MPDPIIANTWLTDGESLYYVDESGQVTEELTTEED